MFFMVATLEGRLTDVRVLDFSSDTGHIATLYEVITCMWSRDEVVQEPYRHGRQEDPQGGWTNRNLQVIKYIVEADAWSTACQLVETLLKAEGLSS